MSRLRGSIKGGYVRKTISLPSTLAKKIEDHLKSQPGMTISAFLTVAGENLVEQFNQKRKTP